MIRWIKSLFRVYEPGFEYLIDINNIKITYDFHLSSPRYSKFIVKEREFLKTGKLGKIELNHNFELVDGYITYLLMKKYDMNKIPVYFVD